MTRLAGHELRYEGAPFNGQRKRIGAGWSTSGEGRALCSCGALSPVLPSANQRKVWHRQHKGLVGARSQNREDI